MVSRLSEAFSKTKSFFLLLELHFEKPIKLMVDASDVGCGAVLLQVE